MKFARKLILAALMPVSLAGCVSEKVARKYSDNRALAAETMSRVNSDELCCASSYKNMNYAPLLIKKRQEIVLSAASPVFLFDFGKSRFAAMSLPVSGKGLEIEITAIEAQSGKSAKPIFRPKVVLLDQNYVPLANQPTLNFDKFHFGATSEGHKAQIYLSSEVRFLVVAADPAFYGKEFLRGGNIYTIPVGGTFVGATGPGQAYPYGVEGKAFIEIIRTVH